MANFNFTLPTVARGVNQGARRNLVTRLDLPMKDLRDWIQDIQVDVYRQELRFEQSRGNLLDPIVETDRKVGKPARKVRPFGIITAYDRVDLAEAMEFIYRKLEAESPVLTGRYKASHIVMKNGESIPYPGRVPDLNERDSIEFVNIQPYAKRIEQGWSPKAPRGVYKRVKKAAERRYGRALYFKFTYRTLNLGQMVTRRIGSNKKPLRTPQRVDAIYPTIVMRFLATKTTARSSR